MVKPKHKMFERYFTILMLHLMQYQYLVITTTKFLTLFSLVYNVHLFVKNVGRTVIMRITHGIFRTPTSIRNPFIRPIRHRIYHVGIFMLFEYITSKLNKLDNCTFTRRHFNNAMSKYKVNNHFCFYCQMTGKKLSCI